MKERVIIIKTCEDCPFHTIDRDHTGDPDDVIYRWMCAKLKMAVRRYVDFDDHTRFIPNDCPLPENRIIG